jgi:hypothetical protein
VGDACDESASSDADGDGVPDGSDNCPAAANPDQADADRDRLGDACDPCPALADPARVAGDCGGEPDSDSDGVPDARDDCPAIADPAQADMDGDGVGDACDPCPADGTCLPLRPPAFGCGGNGGAADALITCLVPGAMRTVVPAGTRSATIVLVIAPDVTPRSVRVRVGGRDRTREAGELVPASTKTLTVPLVRRRTVVRLRATGPRAGTHRIIDVDRLTFLREERRDR